VKARKKTYMLLVLLIVGIYALGAPMIFASGMPAWVATLLVAVGITSALIPLPLMDTYP
jgi:hypothetical protein